MLEKKKLFHMKNLKGRANYVPNKQKVEIIKHKGEFNKIKNRKAIKPKN